MSLSGTARRGAAALYRSRWPVGWWRLRGRGTLEIAGQRISFVDIGGTASEWWALRARRHDWERPVVEAFAAAIRPGDVVYDIGAWIGPYTLLASKLAGPGGRVISFEPDPVAREQLERNLRLNGAGNVQVFAVALTDRNGFAALSGGGSQAFLAASGDVEVPTMTLPDFIAEHAPPDIVKVDIEGGELRLDVAALSQARQIFLEVHVPAFREAGTDVDEYLTKLAAGRPVQHLEGDSKNYNVRIG